MEKIIAFSNKTEARDKFTKAIQYSSKLLAWALLNVNRSYHRRFNELYLMARDSRKIFRLFKSIQEMKTIYDKIKDLLWKREKVPVLFEILSRVGYLIYWVFDNLFILASVRMLKTKSDSLNYLSYIAHMGWLIGIGWALLKNIYEILNLLLSKNKNMNDDEFSEFNRQKEIINLLIRIVGRCGDLIPASSGVNLPEKLLGIQLNDGVVGLGGLLSSVVAMWALWNQF